MTGTQVGPGACSLERLGQEWQRAVASERTAHEALAGAIVSASATMSESEISRRTGMSRVSVRKALGKPPRRGAAEPREARG